MSSPYFKPPRHLVKEWPEVFDGLYMNTMPIAYLDYVHLEFANGRVWQINIKDRLPATSIDFVANQLLETMSEYFDEVVKIDFKIDIARLKKDVSNYTNTLL